MKLSIPSWSLVKDFYLTLLVNPLLFIKKYLDKTSALLIGIGLGLAYISRFLSLVLVTLLYYDDYAIDAAFVATTAWETLGFIALFALVIGLIAAIFKLILLTFQMQFKFLWIYKSVILVSILAFVIVRVLVFVLGLLSLLPFADHTAIQTILSVGTDLIIVGGSAWSARYFVEIIKHQQQLTLKQDFIILLSFLLAHLVIFGPYA